MQQVDSVCDNRTEYITKAVQDALQRQMLSSGTANQPYLQEYIEHLKKEAAEWKAAALHVSGLPSDCSLADPPQPAPEMEEPMTTLGKALCDEELHLEIDETLRTLEEKPRTPHP